MYAGDLYAYRRKYPPPAGTGKPHPYVPAEETEASAETHEENTDSHWEKQYWLGVRLGLAAMVFLTLVAGAVLYIRRNRGRAVHRKGGRYVRK